MSIKVKESINVNMEESKSKYAGLSKGQIKKLKEKEKKEREAKELAE